ncbi:hypothetical protein B0I00_0128 [Novosphingobium kunmingense]|uniref:Uncharacterized protein n=1 Tax=Novosphingobium kunmingense TaxID=1211806 RepID=A0A2N0I182_9SPHN|nr:hypothetical protein [Novosphingobium kunmingense]PKB24948.1 hypothetical protein B0I00_0128 [Novosphingobium kunmingense]
MNAFLNLVAPLALMLPAAVAVDEARAPEIAAEPEVDVGEAAFSVPAAPISRASGDSWRALTDYFRPSQGQQVRIEERVTIRIAPRPAPIMPSMFAQDFAPQQGIPRYVEKKMGKCVPMTAILGVQPGNGNRLIMMLKDRRTVSATLSRACQAQAYYSGFLVAKNADGMICQGRDQLLARNGMNCTVSGFRQIVELGD